MPRTIKLEVTKEALELLHAGVDVVNPDDPDDADAAAALEVELAARLETFDEEAAVSHWDDDDEFPPEDWQLEVENGDTRQGYHDWVASQREMAAEEEPDTPRP